MAPQLRSYRVLLVRRVTRHEPNQLVSWERTAAIGTISANPSSAADSKPRRLQKPAAPSSIASTTTARIPICSDAASARRIESRRRSRPSPRPCQPLSTASRAIKQTGIGKWRETPARTTG